MPDTTPLHQLTRPLSPADLTTYAPALSQLQGNILKSHGRAAALHIFLTFLNDAPGENKKHREIRRFLAGVARKKVVSAAQQRLNAQTFRSTGRSEIFTGLYLSAKAYQYLGLPLEGFASEFRDGMRAAKDRLNDPPDSAWQPEFQKEIHAMLIYAHDSLEELTQQLGSLQDDLKGLAEVSRELGISTKNAAGQVVEHFGYADGVSQPLFYESDFYVKGFSRRNWNPGAGPRLVLVKDPLAASGDACGTYFVFRKLEQNVRAFRSKAEELAAALGLDGAKWDLAAARIIGRFPDGTPAALADQPAGRTNPANDFTYATHDPQGNRCPFGAHIRKVNPRGETIGPNDDPEQERRHRIARRGITYGVPIPPGAALTGLPVGGVGLLFQCCQADLGQQFEFLQSQWANNDNAPRSCGGKDPLIGQSADNALRPLRLAVGEKAAEVAFDSFVTLKGGEYFFAPSIPFLTSLDAPPARAVDPAAAVRSQLRTSGRSSYPGS